MNIKLFKQGFTLIESLLSLMIILLISSIFFSIFYVKKEPTVEPSFPDTNFNRDITNIENALKLYKFDNGVYPSTEQGLEALVIKPTLPPYPAHWVPYLDYLPLAPNGKPYQYTNPGKYNKVDVLIQNSDEDPLSSFYAPLI